jgi:hypothetical protein
MLKNFLGDFIFGSTLVGLCIIAMFLLPMLNINAAIVLPFLLAGIILIKSSTSSCTIHERLMLKTFLKRKIMRRRERIGILADATLLSMFDGYDRWWKSQKEKGLNSEHVSFGIFVEILAGTLEKEEIESYYKHFEKCPICQEYSISWIRKLPQKADECRHKRLL